MKALSIHQPWAWLIAAGYKDVENRTWCTNHRGRVYIHTGKGVDDEDFPALRRVAQEGGLLLPEDDEFLRALPRGAIIGEVHITACRPIDSLNCEPTRPSPWALGPWCWSMAWPSLYDEPVPWKGSLGLFEVPDNFRETVQR